MTLRQDASDAAPLPRRPARPGWSTRLGRLAGDRRVQAQLLFILILALVAAVVWHTAADNLSRQAVKSGFGFLLEPASFELGETPIPFRAGDSYLRAFAVGVLNTIKVAVVGIVLSTVLGLVLALGQLSPSVMLAGVCRAYVELVRNVPLLLQLIFWHTLLTRGLPPVKQAIELLDGVFLTNRGLYLPFPQPDPLHGWVGLAALLGLALTIGLLVAAGRHRRRTGLAPRVGLPALGLLLAPPLLVWLVGGAPLALDQPELKGFNFRGGTVLTPEFIAMVLGLSLYHAAFNAETIRAGILGVPRGQSEAGLSLGLSRWQVMRRIVLPQALRIIIPPLSNSHLSLTKESSLAVAIGYPEVVRVANIAIAATSQAIECIAIIMIIYLTLSLTTALVMNWINRRLRIVER